MGHVRSKTSQGCCQANDAIFELLSLSLVSSCTRVSRLEGLLELSTLSLKRRQLSLVPLLGVMDGGRERVKCVCVCVCVVQLVYLHLYMYSVHVWYYNDYCMSTSGHHLNNQNMLTCMYTTSRPSLAGRCVILAVSHTCNDGSSTCALDEPNIQQMKASSSTNCLVGQLVHF